MLDRWRPVFLALTAILVLHLLLRGKGSRNSRLAIAGVSLLLAASNQLLALHNKGQLLTIPASLAQRVAPLLPLLSRPSEAPAAAPQQSLEAVTLRVQGLKCEGCASHLRQQLLLLQPGVRDVSVDFGSRLVHLALDRQHVDVGRVVEAIRAVDASYEVELHQEGRPAATAAGIGVAGDAAPAVAGAAAGGGNASAD